MKRKNKIILLAIAGTIIGATLSGCSQDAGKVKITMEIEVDGKESEESTKSSEPVQIYDPELDVWLTDVRYGYQDENGNIILYE